MKVFTSVPASSEIAQMNGQAFKVKTPAMKLPVIVQPQGNVYGVFTNDQEFDPQAMPVVVADDYAELLFIVN